MRQSTGNGSRVLDDLDPLDLGIIRLLQEQGRTPNAVIARHLGVSEPTVRKRIERLVGDGILKIVAVLNPDQTGFATDVVIGVRTEPGAMLAVGSALSAMEECLYLGYVTGRFDIIVEMIFRDDAALFRFLNETVPTMPGIVSTETSYVLATGKINYDWKLPSDVGAQRAGAGPARG